MPKNYAAPSRRRLLAGGLTLLGATTMALPAQAAKLLPTPRQTTGPFYPLELPLDSDSNLVEVAGRPAPAAGQVVHLFGRVLTETGKPVPDARVEIWQCDNQGRYHHPGDRGGNADPNFQGYGQRQSDPEGAYRFRTIKPVPYPGRTPHIHVAVSGPEFETLTTQLYLRGHRLNQRDGLFMAVRDPVLRASLLVDFQPAGDLEAGAEQGEFNIVLGQNAFRS